MTSIYFLVNCIGKDFYFTFDEEKRSRQQDNKWGLYSRTPVQEWLSIFLWRYQSIDSIKKSKRNRMTLHNITCNAIHVCVIHLNSAKRKVFPLKFIGRKFKRGNGKSSKVFFYLELVTNHTEQINLIHWESTSFSAHRLFLAECSIRHSIFVNLISWR